MKTFEELGVSEQIRRAISELGFAQPMPVQEQVIPYLLRELRIPNDELPASDPEIQNSELTAELPSEEFVIRNSELTEDGDLIALAQTGTGKTAAFGIPLLQTLDADSRETQALILSPTRELCLQICDDMRDFAKYMPGVQIVPVYGGASIVPQMKQLRRGAQIIVATPGRLIDVVNRGAADLSHVSRVVLDEADEMLNMGFSESINEIFEHLPEERNTLMFSATMSREIERIAKKYLHNHREIVVGSRNEGAEHVNHVYYLVNAKDKYLALKRIVDYYPRIFAIIFCRTKLETQEVADKLIRDGYNAEALHGDLSQDQRDLTMQKFRQHTVQLLVATDVAARGLDVDDLTHVINYGLPDDIENYTHRSGRTGRAGKKGTSIAIIHTREKHKVRQIEKEIGKEFVDGTLPTPQEICTKQLYRSMEQIEKVDVEEELIAPFMAEINRHFEYVDKEDIIKKIVTMTFGRFLSYYADAPEIEKPLSRKELRREGGKELKREGGKERKPEKGYTRLFINLGKADGFYPGEVMQMLNRYVGGRLQVGHIDLFPKFSYFEVPDRDARRVMQVLTGTLYKGREVRCNAADDTPDNRQKAPRQKGGQRSYPTDFTGGFARGGAGRRNYAADFTRGAQNAASRSTQKSTQRGAQKSGKLSKKRGFIENFDSPTGDWRDLMKPRKWDLKGAEPDFSEEGWARRKPRKKK